MNASRDIERRDFKGQERDRFRRGRRCRNQAALCNGGLVIAVKLSSVVLQMVDDVLACTMYRDGRSMDDNVCEPVRQARGSGVSEGRLRATSDGL